MERISRGSVMVITFMEALLQAYQYGDTPLIQMENIFKCMIHAIKSLLQLQVAMVCQFTQLRQNIYLAGATSVSSDVLTSLRHSPVLEQTNLFSNDSLLSMITHVGDSLESSLIIQSIRSSQNHSKNFLIRARSGGAITTKTHPRSREGYFQWSRHKVVLTYRCCPHTLQYITRVYLEKR